jgi:hypothetical protein
MAIVQDQPLRWELRGGRPSMVVLGMRQAHFVVQRISMCSMQRN